MRISGLVALDVETTGERRSDVGDPRKAIFELAAVAPQGVVTRQIPVIEPSAEVIVHNMPYDAVVCGVWDAKWHDTKVEALLAGQLDTSLKGLIVRLFGEPVMYHNQAMASDQLAGYCMADAVNTYRLHPYLLDEMRPETRRLYNDLEQPLLALWAKMTLEGSFHLDREGLLTYRDELTKDIDAALVVVQDALPRGQMVKVCLQCGIYDESKEPGKACPEGKGKRMSHKWEARFDMDKGINLNSPSQLLDGLRYLGLTGLKDTQDQTLQLIRHIPAVEKLLTYREKFKLLSTYVDPWLAWPDDRLFGSVWRPAGTWTGRVSSAHPNFQNIPEGLLRFLLPPEDDMELATWDNAQLEIRMAAHQSQDPQLLEVCRAGDLHGELQQVFGAPNRRATKVWIFGTMYLGGIGAIIQQANSYGYDMTRTEASNVQQTVRERMPHYFRYTDTLRGHRIVKGMFGRYHYLPPGGEMHMDRMAVNCGPQGGAGTVTKFQQLALDRAGLRVVKQVHDSVTLAYPKKDRDEVHHDVPRIMESAAPPLDVPIKVEVQ